MKAIHNNSNLNSNCALSAKWATITANRRRPMSRTTQITTYSTKKWTDRLPVLDQNHSNLRARPQKSRTLYSRTLSHRNLANKSQNRTQMRHLLFHNILSKLNRCFWTNRIMNLPQGMKQTLIEKFFCKILLLVSIMISKWLLTLIWIKPIASNLNCILQLARIRCR